MASTSVSTFLTPSPTAKQGDLASLYLRRDHSLPTILSSQVTSASEQGYAEGVVTNTRFGSFPHSTIIGVPWGSQVRASKVDTGSRGRPGKGKNLKRKADEALLEEGFSGVGASAGALGGKEAVAAESGYLHVLPPTPENWTTSLPHRTQVVYTPDYSYILHRICARPGSRLIEAGSGSGSFTHAAARAVFNGYPQTRGINGEIMATTTHEESKTLDADDVVVDKEMVEDQGKGDQRAHNDNDGRDNDNDDELGRVFTYEFHRERHEKVQAEMIQHGLDSIVRAMHRDVYSGGFLVYDSDSDSESAAAPSDDKLSPRANAIFLDLPAPWEAIPHLTRDPGQDGTPSALDPSSTAHICTFSPCIEQAQRTVSALRRHDWIDIEMVETQHHRIDVRREYTGLQYDGMRGANSFAADVDEAVSRLRSVEQRLREFHDSSHTKGSGKSSASSTVQPQDALVNRFPFNQGRLVHRTEQELKTHTSYLVFAILPRAWTEEDEAAAQDKWSKNVQMAANVPKSQRQWKKEAKQRTKAQKRNGVKPGAPDTATEQPLVVDEQG